MKSNTREFNRILELELLRKKEMRLIEAHLVFSEWMNKGRIGKVDPELLQQIFDLKELQMDFAMTLRNYIQKEFDLAGGVSK